MKKIFHLLTLFAFAASLAVADPPTETVLGQARVSVAIITWSAASGNWTNKCRHMLLGNAVYVDTSSTGLAGEWKRIDNTADSASNPFLLSSAADGRIRPIAYSPMIGSNTYAKFTGVDSSIHVYRLHVRERFWSNATNSWAPTAWSQKGSGLAYSDNNITDSVLVPNVGIATTKTWNYGVGNVLGAEARAVPDDVAATANESTDSIIIDTAWAISR